MGTLVVILIVVALIGATIWNKRTAAAAMEGVRFQVDASAETVAGAIVRAFNLGAGAKLKSALGGIRVERTGDEFRFATKIGDVGVIRLAESGAVTVVDAMTTELYVGSHPKGHSRSNGIWGFATAMTHRIYQLIGITPSAGKMKRFQLRLEGTISKQLRKAGAST